MLKIQKICIITSIMPIITTIIKEAEFSPAKYTWGSEGLFLNLKIRRTPLLEENKYDRGKKPKNIPKDWSLYFPCNSKSDAHIIPMTKMYSKISVNMIIST